MIVITLTKTPASLRGDLTKWCQEIQTGVYGGNFSSRIREQLWERILRNIGNGEATLVYNTDNELGYTFKTTRQDRKVVYYDGIPLMMHLTSDATSIKHGFSKAAKLHKTKKFIKKSNFDKSNPMKISNDWVAVDLETTGLYAEKDKIISMGAVKQDRNGHLITFYRLIKIEGVVPDKIVKLTGLDKAQLNENGIDLGEALKEFKAFLGNKIIVGYNLSFDADFLMKGCRDTKQKEFTNSMKDLMPIVKSINVFLDNYRLETVLKEYGIKNKNKHNALNDAEATFELAIKLNKNGKLRI